MLHACSVYFVTIGQNEGMEMDVGDPVTTLTSREPVELKTLGAVVECERESTGGKSRASPVQQEILAAEEFERTSDCNVEFEFHVD